MGSCGFYFSGSGLSHLSQGPLGSPFCHNDSISSFFFFFLRSDNIPLYVNITFFFFFFVMVILYRGEVISHCGLICISLMISDDQHLFMFLLAIYLFERNVSTGPLPIFNWVIYLFIFLLNCVHVISLEY